MLAGGPTEAAAEQRGGSDSGRGFEKGAAIYGMKTYDGVPPIALLSAKSIKAACVLSAENHQSRHSEVSILTT
jgi:hypothetical protein